MTPQDLYTIIGANIVAGAIVVAVFWRITSRIASNQRADDARADADRRAFQQSMDDFRKEMQRLAERQSHTEGRSDTGTAANAKCVAVLRVSLHPKGFDVLGTRFHTYFGDSEEELRALVDPSDLYPSEVELVACNER